MISDITREKIRQAVKLQMSQKDENGKSINHPSYGKKASLETREKLRISHLGQAAWNKGKTNYLSGESRRKMGLGSLGKPGHHLGKKHSMEARRKMSES